MRRFLATAAVACVCLVATATASAQRPGLVGSGVDKAFDRCSGHVCVVLESDLDMFSTDPGEFVQPPIRNIDIATANGRLLGEGIHDSTYIWADWGDGPSIDAEWTVGPSRTFAAGPLRNQSIVLKVSDTPTDGMLVDCGRSQYIACRAERSWGDLADRREINAFSTYDQRGNGLSLVRLSTRTLIVRVVNQTGHTLQRTSPSVLTTGVLRDERIGDPVTIPSYRSGSDDNVGWYHFYRQAVRAKRASSFDATYTLRGAQQTNLDGATVRIVVSVKPNGDDDETRCIADDRFATYLQCSVAVTGTPSGRLIATAYVAQ